MVGNYLLYIRCFFSDSICRGSSLDRTCTCPVYQPHQASTTTRLGLGMEKDSRLDCVDTIRYDRYKKKHWGVPLTAESELLTRAVLCNVSSELRLLYI